MCGVSTAKQITRGIYVLHKPPFLNYKYNLTKKTSFSLKFALCVYLNLFETRMTTSISSEVKLTQVNQIRKEFNDNTHENLYIQFIKVTNRILPQNTRNKMTD